MRLHNDLFFDNLKGSVEKVKEIPYSVDSNGKIGAADSCCVSILAFNKRGYRTMDVSEDALGKGMSGQLYMKRYDDGKPKEIQVVTNGSTKKHDGIVEIMVKDNGNGIPKSNLGKIFQPFFTTKPTGQGTGLGLSLAYDIIKAHGGEIKVETKEGEGTEFIVQLPI